MFKQDRRRLTAISWVQATRLGVDLLADAATLHAWVTDLLDGRTNCRRDSRARYSLCHHSRGRHLLACADRFA